MEMKMLADFLEDFERLVEGGFLSWCVGESAIWFIEKNISSSSFCHPLYTKATVFLHFSVYWQSSIQVVLKTMYSCYCYYII